MAKNKSESNGVAVQDGPQLMLAIDLDDIENIETSADPAEPAAPVSSRREGGLIVSATAPARVDALQWVGARAFFCASRVRAPFDDGAMTERRH
jgi:hypothetical protein